MALNASKLLTNHACPHHHDNSLSYHIFHILNYIISLLFLHPVRKLNTLPFSISLYLNFAIVSYCWPCQFYAICSENGRMLLTARI